MKTYKKVLLTAAVAMPSALLLTGQAQAQTVAYADPDAAVAKTKAFTDAMTIINTTYKTQLDQAKARAEAIRKDIEPLRVALDLNNDGEVDQQEAAIAEQNKRPELAQLQQKQAAAQQELGTLQRPAALAQQYVIEQLSPKLGEAVQTAMNARGVQILLKPGTTLVVLPSGDLTKAISDALDAAVGSHVNAIPPAGWQPGQQGQAPGTPSKKPAGR